MTKADECPHCRSGPETYWYLGLFDFDVDLARRLTADGREAVEVDDESVRDSVHDSVIHEPHLDHVDTRFPGIIAHVQYPGESGEMAKGHVLIDGNHRAARCLRDGKPFLAYILTEEESQAILLERSETALPRGCPPCPQ